MPKSKDDGRKSAVLLAFGETVRQRRQELGFSQEAFSDACGIDRSYMGAIERGEHNISLFSVIRIVEALETSPSEFFSAIENVTTKSRRLGKRT